MINHAKSTFQSNASNSLDILDILDVLHPKASIHVVLHRHTVGKEHFEEVVAAQSDVLPQQSESERLEKNIKKHNKYKVCMTCMYDISSECLGTFKNVHSYAFLKGFESRMEGPKTHLFSQILCHLYRLLDIFLNFGILINPQLQTSLNQQQHLTLLRKCSHCRLEDSISTKSSWMFFGAQTLVSEQYVILYNINIKTYIYIL